MFHPQEGEKGLCRNERRRGEKRRKGGDPLAGLLHLGKGGKKEGIESPREGGTPRGEKKIKQGSTTCLDRVDHKGKKAAIWQ